MIRSLYLSNFKAFADTEGQPIPIRPITLIFGPNSAGKSSLIHSLLLAHEALNFGELDVQHTKIGGRSVDLGGFRQYVHKHRTETAVEWGVEVGIEGLDDSYFKNLLAGASRLKAQVQIGMQHEEHPLTGIVTPVGGPLVQRYELLVDDVQLLTMSWRPQGYLQLDLLDTDHPVMGRVVESIVLSNTTTGQLTFSDRDAVERGVAELIPDIRAVADHLVPRETEPVDGVKFSKAGATLVPISQADREKGLAQAVRRYLPRALDAILGGVYDALRSELGRMSYLGPLRSYPSRHFAFSEDQDENWFAGGGHAWDITRKDPEVREAVNNWLRSDRLSNPYELRIRRLISDRSDEVQVQLYHGLQEIGRGLGFDVETGELDRDGLEHDGLPAGWDSEEFANELSHLLTNREAIEGYDELTLWDVKRETEVSHRDVGIGISQVLPVLVLAHASEGSVIAIEQPEIHVHPALQAELGDVFIESALGPHENTFLIETHSEHLILRILRRIRETTEGELEEGHRPIRPGDVAVLYVDPRDRQTAVVEIPVTEDGDFATQWPAGFFTEREKELF